MSLILHIETTSQSALVAIASDGNILCEERNEAQKDHAAFLQPAIKSMIAKVNISLEEVAAVAVSAGPGSYTGIRVGMASAKGLCYALNKPLILLNQLEILAKAVADQEAASGTSALYCPMIDARRMEVFTSVYSNNLDELMAPAALVLDGMSYNTFLLNNPVFFFGSGADKWQNTCSHPNAHFTAVPPVTNAMCTLSDKKFKKKEFSDIAYAEPLYIKEFFTTAAAR